MNHFFQVLREVLITYLNGHRGGLLPHKEDERDLQFGSLFGFLAYQPKHEVFELPTISIKSQNPFNTCVWNSAVAQKEVDEKVPLSVKFFVDAAKAKGRLWGNGFAYLRDAQITLCDTGVCEEALCPDVKTSWDTYSSNQSLSYTNSANATLHKSSRYFAVRTKDEILKALDDGHAVQTGFMWFSGYNNAGSAPLVIGSGRQVGGHAVLLKGYDMKKGLFKFQNSFGKDYGDNGHFYVRMGDWLKLGTTGYVSVDIDNASLFAIYEGKDVKSDTSPAIFRVENGMKRVYPNEKIFFKYGGKFNPKTWVPIANSILNSIPDGQPMA